MSITFNAKTKTFKLDAGQSSYIFQIDHTGCPVHLYFGPHLETDDLGWLRRNKIRAFSPYPSGGVPTDSRDLLKQEYSTFGIGDFRVPSAQIRTATGHAVCDMRYCSHMIYPGKPSLSGLPATFGTEDEVDTLELTLFDAAAQLEYTLIYSAFRNVNAIARSVKVANKGDQNAFVEKIASCTLDFDETELELISFPGAWARERCPERAPLRQGIVTLASGRGLSSHQMNPAFALVSPETTEEFGRAYGATLLYSGNFAAEFELDQFGAVRTQFGINPENFEWKLAPNAEFQTPETVLVFSGNGLGEMSRSFHNLFRTNLIRSSWRDRKRPILVNNWEATYFNFDSEKLLSIARDAATLGIEMLVLDDGWFGKRDDDHSGLGDWFVNEPKLGGSLASLVDKINGLGLKFGLWFEPEMISRDSRLFEAHPDWCLSVPGRTMSEGRQQLVLDMSRTEVVDYLFGVISDILDHAKIEYIKWDANRHLTEVGSAVVEPDRQREVAHRFVLGMYELHERLLERYPDLLIEGCSGGGGRFDAGMLYYVPQIWTSDDTDAIERLKIQYGTSMFYPPSSMGAHVSDCPNHQTQRVTSFETRGIVALAGTFGYELDLNKMTEEEREEIRRQVALYHQLNPVIAQGDLYRLSSAMTDSVTAWLNIAKDKSECVLSAVRPRVEASAKHTKVYLRGLEPDAIYCEMSSGRSFRGDTLMNAGFPLELAAHDGAAGLWHFVRK